MWRILWKKEVGDVMELIDDLEDVDSSGFEVIADMATEAMEAMEAMELESKEKCLSKDKEYKLMMLDTLSRIVKLL